jgi:hypothetical protein
VRVGSIELVGDNQPRGMAVTSRATAMHKIRRIGRLHTFSIENHFSGQKGLLVGMKSA